MGSSLMKLNANKLTPPLITRNSFIKHSRTRLDSIIGNSLPHTTEK